MGIRVRGCEVRGRVRSRGTVDFRVTSTVLRLMYGYHCWRMTSDWLPWQYCHIDRNQSLARFQTVEVCLWRLESASRTEIDTELPSCQDPNMFLYSSSGGAGRTFGNPSMKPPKVKSQVIIESVLRYKLQDYTVLLCWFNTTSRQPSAPRQQWTGAELPVYQI